LRDEVWTEKVRTYLSKAKLAKIFGILSQDVAGKLPIHPTRKKGNFFNRFFGLDFFTQEFDLTHLVFPHILCKFAYLYAQVKLGEQTTDVRGG
jgi:hypothetical protein